MALMALLPLIASGMPNGGAGTFTLLLAGIGAGAVATALFLTRMRQAMSRDTLVLGGAVLQAIGTAILAVTDNVYVAVSATFLAGIGWISAANTMTLSVQLALPDWVRARGMSIFLIALMGASAFGAALWGQVASLTSVHATLGIASVTGILFMLVAHRLILDRTIEEDLTPSDRIKAPVVEQPPKTGKIYTTIEYWIDPARATEYRKVMDESRRSRLRQGALSCQLLRDIAQPSRYFEQIVDDSWTEQLRRFDRVTAGDIALRERKLAFHILDTPPIVTRYVTETTPAG
jgi:MFS family permease